MCDIMDVDRGPVNGADREVIEFRNSLWASFSSTWCSKVPSLAVPEEQSDSAQKWR